VEVNSSVLSGSFAPFHILLLSFTCALDLPQPMSFTVIGSTHKNDKQGHMSQSFPAHHLSIINGLVGQAIGLLYHTIRVSKGPH